MDTKHECHATGCKTHIPPSLFMCGRHWRIVPKRLQKAIWALYRPGQEQRKDPTLDYLKVARAAVWAVAIREGRWQKQDVPEALRELVSGSARRPQGSLL